MRCVLLCILEAAEGVAEVIEYVLEVTVRCFVC